MLDWLERQFFNQFLGSVTTPLHKIEQQLAELIDIGNQQLDTERLSLEQLAKLVRLLAPPKPVKLVIQFQGEQPGMASQVQEGLLIGASDHEFNAEGEEVTITNPAALTYAVDDTTIAQIIMPADDPSIPVGQAKVKGLKVGVVHVTSTDTSATPPLVSEPLELDVTMDPVANKLVVSLA